jgi:Tol biopolymer transport system component
VIRVAATTTGALLDRDGYAVGLDGGSGRSVDANGALLIPDVTPGDHALVLSGVACNCSLAESEPVAVTVSAGDTADATFAVTCEEIGRLAFVDREGESAPSDIYVIDLDGSGRTRLTNGLGAGGPRWSPDGSKIAYVTAAGIGVMNADGSGHRMLTQSATDGSPSWSPDGARMAFGSGRDDPQGEIYVMNADGGDVRRLTSDEDSDADPAWSPDGSRIAFVSSRGESEFGTDIYTMNPGGGDLTSLTEPGFAFLLSPAWSPDGNMIVYYSYEPMIPGLHILTLDGTPVPYEWVDLVEDGSDPAWSPGGSWIAYSQYDGLGVIHPDRTDSTQLTSGYSPDWAPAVLVQSPEAGVSGCAAGSR